MAYGEVQGKIWRSPSVRGLSKDLKLAWVYLLTNEHSNMIGYYQLPIAYMADDLEWPVDQAKDAIKTLEQRSLIAYDHAAQIVFVCKFLKYNHLPSGRREEGGINRVEQLPESPLLVRLLSAVAEWHPKLTNLRACLNNMTCGDSLFGVQEESKRSPVAPLDIDTGVDTVVDTDYVATDSIIDYLNEQTQSDFKHSKHSRENIHARLADGLTADECKLIIDYKCREWLGDTEWEGNLNPVTLFRPKKYENNLNAARKWAAKGRPSKKSQTPNGRPLGEYDEHVKEA